MKKLHSLDLYGALILICLVLLPVCGYWCLKTQERIDACTKAIYDAARPGGYLQEIGALKNQVEIVNGNRSGDVSQPGKYFDGQILASVSGGGLSSTDFSVGSPKQEEFTPKGGSKQKVRDHVVEIQWKNKERKLQLDFISALLFNCESGAGPGNVANMQSVWKLRDLTIVNLTDEKEIAADRTPPPELSDFWSIRHMAFARREPAK